MSTLIEFADRLRAQIDIVKEVEERVPLRRAGQTLLGRCPFHREKTPSFTVSASKQFFHCFGCKAGGDVVKFVSMIEHIEWVDALRLLSDKYRIPMPARSGTRDAETDTLRERLLEINKLAVGHFTQVLEASMKNPAHEITGYMERRGLDMATIGRFGLGLAPDAWATFLDAGRKAGFERDTMVASGMVIHNRESDRHYDRFRKRLIFPICDGVGRPIAFGGRVYASDAAKDEPKYVNSPETVLYKKGQHLYALHLAREAIVAGKCALLMEGYMDVIRAHQCGFTNAVASCGTALTEEQARTLKKYAPTVLFVYDGDDAGQKAMLRGSEILLDQDFAVKIVALPPEHDPDTYLREAGAEAFRAQLSSARDAIEFFLEAAAKRHNPATIDGKVQAAEAVLPLLLRVRNPIARTEYVRLVASRLGIEPAALARRLRSREEKASDRLREQVQAVAPEQGRREQMLLKVAVESPQARTILAAECDPEWFEHPTVRKWFAAWLQADIDEPPGWDALLTACTDEEEAAFLRSVAVDDHDPLDDTEDTLRHVLARMEFLHHRRQNLQLTRQIEEYARTGTDHEAVADLSRQIDGSGDAIRSLGNRIFLDRPRIGGPPK